MPELIFQVQDTGEVVGRRTTWLVPPVGQPMTIDSRVFVVRQVWPNYDNDTVLIEVDE
jgi:hypothetical protein